MAQEQAVETLDTTAGPPLPEAPDDEEGQPAEGTAGAEPA